MCYNDKRLDYIQNNQEFLILLLSFFYKLQP